MITALVQSAFQTGYLSVESEGLLRQVLTVKGCKATDIQQLEQLYQALQTGQIQREAPIELDLPLIHL